MTESRRKREGDHRYTRAEKHHLIVFRRLESRGESRRSISSTRKREEGKKKKAHALELELKMLCLRSSRRLCVHQPRGMFLPAGMHLSSSIFSSVAHSTARIIKTFLFIAAAKVTRGQFIRSSSLLRYSHRIAIQSLFVRITR